MQVTINVPDNIPKAHLEQKLRELEDSLQLESKVLDENRKNSPSPSNNPWKNPDAPFPSVDTGIEDLSLNHDHYLYGAPKRS